MRRLLNWSFRHPLIVLLILFVGSFYSASQLPRLFFDASPEGLMIKNDPGREAYRKAIDTFGTDRVMVVCVKDQHLFTPKKLGTLQKLTDALSDLPGVQKCESLFSVSRLKGQDGILETGPLLESVPESDDDAKQVLRDALRNPLMVRNLISNDGTTTAINLFLDPSNKDRSFSVDISTRIDRVVASHKDAFDQVFQIGTAYIWRVIIESLKNDQKTLIPLCAAALLLMLILTTGSLSGAAMPAITTGLSVLWTLGFMAWAGIPLNVLTFIIPSLIIVIGSTEDVHMLSEYAESLESEESHGDRNTAIHMMSANMGTAVLLTSLTTVLGFLSVLVNEITMLQQFAVVGAFGLFVNPLITFLVAPVYLRYLGRRHVPHREPGAVDRLMRSGAERLMRFVLHHKKPVLAVLLGGAALIGLFSVGVKVDNDVMGFFRARSPITQRVAALRRDLAGAQFFFVTISSGTPGTFKQPENLAQVDRVEHILNQVGGFDKTISLADHLKTIHREMNGGQASFHVLPDKPELVSQYLLLLRRDEIERYVNAEFSEVNIVVRHNLNSSHALLQALDACEQAIRKELNPYFRLDFTGETVLINRAADSIALGQATSFGLMLGLIFVIMAIMFMNFKASVISVIPNLFPIAIFFGVIAIFRIPLDIGTCMVADIAIGLAMDDTIHMMTRYNQEMHTLKSEEMAIIRSYRSEFKPVVATSIALSMGFAVLAFSDFMPIVNFGLLSAMVMILGLLGEVMITPILLSSTKLLTLWDMLSLRLQADVIGRAELFSKMRTWEVRKVILLGRVLTCKAGEFVYKEMDRVDCMYFILEGEVRLHGHDDSTGGKVGLAYFGPSDVFGEAYLAAPGASAESAQAVTDVRYVELNYDDLTRARLLYPWTAAQVYENLARILGNRLVVSSMMYIESRKAGAPNPA
jgi:uncharacterized protein